MFIEHYFMLARRKRRLSNTFTPPYISNEFDQSLTILSLLNGRWGQNSEELSQAPLSAGNCRLRMRKQLVLAQHTRPGGWGGGWRKKSLASRWPWQRAVGYRRVRQFSLLNRSEVVNAVRLRNCRVARATLAPQASDCHLCKEPGNSCYGAEERG